MSKFWIKIFYPTPLGGGTKKMKIFKKRHKSKIWALYLKNWASYGRFRESSREIQKIFKSQNITDFLRFGPILFSCEVNIYFWKPTQSFKVKQQFRALKLIVDTLCPPPPRPPMRQHSHHLLWFMPWAPIVVVENHIFWDSSKRQN